MLHADYFDGRSTRLRVVSLLIDGADLIVAGEGLECRNPEALALGRHEHRIGGVDPQWHLRGIDTSQDEQRHVAGEGRRRSGSARVPP